MTSSYFQKLRQDQIAQIYRFISAATAKDVVASAKKLKALMSVDFGLSTKKFDEYLGQLIDSGKVQMDGDDLLAVI